MSASYGSCELELTASGLVYYNSLWGQAAAQGISVFVASGDTGSSICGGVPSVSQVCSTPYDVCVGGTQFDDTPASAYWAPTPDPITQASALSYIPEQAWNELLTGATGGGASAVFPKPAWQVAPGVPDDGRRDLPDVALASAVHDGYLVVIGHQANPPGLYAIGGTSAAAPAFAGLMALILQKTGSRQGNANPALYRLGNDQYSRGGPSVFHDITAGNNSFSGVPGYACGTGYDLATGLGSVDASALAANWTPVAPPDFVLAASPADFFFFSPGQAVTFTVTTEAFNGFHSAIALSVSGMPAGVTAAFNPATLPGSGSSALVVSTAPAAATGLLSLTVSATGGGVTHSVPIDVLLLYSGVTSGISSVYLPPNLFATSLAFGPPTARCGTPPWRPAVLAT